MMITFMKLVPRRFVALVEIYDVHKTKTQENKFDLRLGENQNLYVVNLCEYQTTNKFVSSICIPLKLSLFFMMRNDKWCLSFTTLPLLQNNNSRFPSRFAAWNVFTLDSLLNFDAKYIRLNVFIKSAPRKKCYTCEKHKISSESALRFSYTS